MCWACASHDLKSQTTSNEPVHSSENRQTDRDTKTNENDSQVHQKQHKNNKQTTFSFKNIDEAYLTMTKQLAELPEESVKSAFELAINTLKKDPEHVRANIVLFEAHLYKGNKEQIVEQFKRLISIRPKTPERCIELGTVIAKLGKIPEAMFMFQRSVDLDPNFSTGYYNLGRAYFMQHYYDKAIIAYKKTIELDPQEHRAWNNLGWVYMAQKNYEDCEFHLKKSIEVKKNYPVAHLNLGLAYIVQKKLDDAEQILKKYIELKPEDSEGYRNLSSVYQQKGDLDAAIQTLKNFLERKPDDIVAKNNLAVLLLSKAKYKESVRLLKSIKDKKVKDPKFKKEVLKTLAVASYHLAESLAKINGKHHQAIESYQDYLQFSENLSPKNIKSVKDKIKRLENLGMLEK